LPLSFEDWNLYVSSQSSVATALHSARWQDQPLGEAGLLDGIFPRGDSISVFGWARRPETLQPVDFVGSRLRITTSCSSPRPASPARTSARSFAPPTWTTPDFQGPGRPGAGRVGGYRGESVWGHHRREWLSPSRRHVHGAPRTGRARGLGQA